MKSGFISMMVMIFLGTSIVGCAPKTDADSEIIAVITENLKTLQEKNLAGYMATIDETSPAYSATARMIAQLFKDYDLQYELKDVKVISKSANEAEASFVQITRKINGPEFRDNQIKGVHTLRKPNGKWKIYSTEIKKTDVEYLN